MNKKVAVILAGCGVKDGSEIHESVIALLSLYRHSAQPVFFAPDDEQTQVVDHLTGQVVDARRNMLQEAARIARGVISPLSSFNADDVDALIFPGGFGAAVNLCDFGASGEHCTVRPDVVSAIEAMYQQRKPIGAICIAPVIVARVLGKHGVELTIGNDKSTSSKIELMGARHVDCRCDQVHVDRRNKVVSTPAYMLGKNAAEIEKGIDLLVKELLAL